MKKIIAILLILTLAISTMFICYAHSSDVTLIDDNDVFQYGFSNETTEIIKSRISNGGLIYYGTGTMAPQYLDSDIITRGIPTDIVNLPSGGAVTDYNMTSGNDYYSPYLFSASSSCTMKIQRTCTQNYNPCNIKLQVIDKTSNTVVFNNNLYVNATGNTSSIPLTGGHEYYLIVTPLDAGNSFVSLFVYAQ